MDVGATGDVVTVEATPPSLHTPSLRTDTAALTTTVTEKATQELPLNGRNYINLVQVTPGATEGLNNGLASGNRPDDRRQTSSVSVNGQADMIIDQLIDGMNNNARHRPPLVCGLPWMRFRRSAFNQRFHRGGRTLRRRDR